MTLQRTFPPGVFWFVLNYLFNKYVLSAYNIPETALHTAVNNISKSLLSRSLGSSGQMQALNNDEYESHVG